MQAMSLANIDVEYAKVLNQAAQLAMISN